MSNKENIHAVPQPDGMMTNEASEMLINGQSHVAQIDAKMKELSDRMQAVTDAFLNLVSGSCIPTNPPKDLCLSEPTIEAIADRLITSKNVIVMAGAGISTAAGIPDFRTPGEGIYDNLKKYNLPTPQSIFKLDYFKSNPEPFFTLAKELYPEKLQPTISHCFLKLLHDKGVLRRVFSQNIDTLELCVGLPEEKVMEAHGSFKTGTCLECQEKYDKSWVKDSIFQAEIPHCERYKMTEDGEEIKCNGIVKPDIVFFGERLPNEYHCKSSVDFPLCDLLIIIGTSLSVAPFNRLAEDVKKTCPRFMMNRDKVCHNYKESSMSGSPLFYFDMEGNHRDVFCSAQCDDGVQMLASLAGWGPDLEAIVEEYLGEKICCKKYVRGKVASTEEDNVKIRSEEGNSTDETAVHTESLSKEVTNSQILNPSQATTRSDSSRGGTASSQKLATTSGSAKPMSTTPSVTKTHTSSSSNPGIPGSKARNSSSTAKPSANVSGRRSSGSVKKAVPKTVRK